MYVFEILPPIIFSIYSFSTGLKPCPSRRPPAMAKFRKFGNGSKDRRGGGLVLDCCYEICLTDGQYRQYLLDEVQCFIKDHDGDEEIVY